MAEEPEVSVGRGVSFVIGREWPGRADEAERDQHPGREVPLLRQEWTDVIVPE